MLLSILFITRNRKEELIRAITSCMRCNLPNETEFIIVDNGSTDGTEKEVKDFLEGRNLQYIYSKTNLGVAGGRKVGFEYCRGRYVYVLDDDAWIVSGPDSFNYLLRYMEEHTNVAAVATEIYDKRKEDYLYPYWAKGFVQGQDGEVMFFFGGSHLIRREVFRGQALYPDNLMYGSEEMYPCIIAADKGYKIIYLSDFKCVHQPSESSRIWTNEEILLNGLINVYGIKKLLYPKILHLVLVINFVLRLIKHFSVNFLVIRKAFLVYNERFGSQESRPVKFQTIEKLVKKYGFRTCL